jgi:predicted RNA-binding protein
MISGEELEGLGLWVDDGDAVLEDGEMLTAEEAGIASISTDMKIVLDDDGKQLMQSSATTIDGEEILTEDVWFAEVTEVSEEMTALNEEMNQITSEDVMVA